jgi:dienelactone hydrolase
MSQRFIAFTLFSIVFSLINAREHTFLISYEKLATVETEELKKRWKENNVPQIMIPIRWDVDIYDVKYRTRWHDGTIIMASGVYFVPRQNKYQVPVLLYNHGTNIPRKRSNYGYNGEDNICIGFATNGYAVAFQDYIGLGHGDKFHLYQHAESEAQSGVDMIRAIKELNREIGVVWDNRLFITGYSQGGHATLAAHRKFQEEYGTEFRVTASSPMSGAYDMAGAQAKVMFEEYTQPFYLPYLLNSYNEVYKVIEGDIHQIYKAPYDTMIPRLFDGSRNIGEINRSLPKIPSQMIKDSLVNLFLTDPDYPFMKAIRENEVFNWKPESPVQICYCTSDEEVYYMNAIVAYNTMKDLGATDVRLKLSGKNQTHGQCAIFTSIYTKFFFDSILKGTYPEGANGPFFKRTLAALAKTQINNKPTKVKRKERKIDF